MFNGTCLPDGRSSLNWKLLWNVTERSWTSNKQVTSWSYQLKLFKLVFTINTNFKPARNHSYQFKLDFPIGTALLQYREGLYTCFIEGHGLTAQWTMLLSFFSSHKLAWSMLNVKNIYIYIYRAVLSSSFNIPSCDVEQVHSLFKTYDQLFDGCCCRICQ